MRKAYAALALIGVISAVHVERSDSTGTTVEEHSTQLAETKAETMNERDYKSTEWSNPISLTFENETDETVQLWWYDYSGVVQPYAKINSQGAYNQWTYATHPWVAKGVNSSTSTFTIDGNDVLVPGKRDANRTLKIKKNRRNEPESESEPESEEELEEYKSTAWSETVLLNFVNETDEAIQMWWHDYSGNLRPYQTLQPNQTRQQWTYATHPWSATCGSRVQLTTGDNAVFVPEANDHEGTITIRKAAEASDDDSPISDEEPLQCQNINNDPTVTVTGHNGTIFIDPDWVPDEAQTTLRTIDDGTECRQAGYDRRDASWQTRNFWCFQAHFEEGLESVRVQVNRDDFDYAQAATHADFYAIAVGRIPKILRLDLDTITIHDGDELFGGGNRDILIHTAYAEQVYAPLHNLEETLIHEGTHTSLDGHLYGTEKWIEAVEKDNKFVSNYALENPQREDISETYIVWFATRYTPDEFTEEELADWECYMGNRFKVFDEMSCVPGMMSPYPDC